MGATARQEQNYEEAKQYFWRALKTRPADPGARYQLHCRDLAVGDYDNDGALDVLIANNGDGAVLLKSQAARGNNWLGLRLEGVACNRDAIDARILWQPGRQIAPPLEER